MKQLLMAVVMILVDPCRSFQYSTSFGNSDYTVVLNSVDWQAAKSGCEAMDMHLATPGSAAENNKIFMWLSMYGLATTDYWIGLSDPDEDGTWNWESNGEEFSSWEPQSVNKKRCVAFRADHPLGMWKSEKCNTDRNYICEKENPPGCPDSSWYSNDFNCYKFETDKKRWTDAMTSCPNMYSGSHLLQIETEDEFNFISNVIITDFPGRNNKFWTAGNMQPQITGDNSGIWYWGDGEDNPIVDFFWGRKEPNFLRGNEFCLNLLKGEENDAKCKRKFYYICEISN